MPLIKKQTFDPDLELAEEYSFVEDRLAPYVFVGRRKLSGLSRSIAAL